MPNRSSKKPADLNQLAKHVVEQATADAAPAPEPERPAKNPAAVALGKLGGKKGGLARAAKLSKKRRSEIARKAARARWGNRQN